MAPSSAVAYQGQQHEHFLEILEILRADSHVCVPSSRAQTVVMTESLHAATSRLPPLLPCCPSGHLAWGAPAVGYDHAMERSGERHDATTVMLSICETDPNARWRRGGQELNCLRSEPAAQELSGHILGSSHPSRSSGCGLVSKQTHHGWRIREASQGF